MGGNTWGIFFFFFFFFAVAIKISYILLAFSGVATLKIMGYNLVVLYFKLAFMFNKYSRILLLALCSVILTLLVVWIAGRAVPKEHRDGIKGHPNLQMNPNTTNMDEDFGMNVTRQVQDMKRAQNNSVEEEMRRLEERINVLADEVHHPRGKTESKVTQMQDVTHQSLQSINEKINSLGREFKMLSDQLHRPVHLYNSCIKEQASCSIGSRGNGVYWKACRTKLLDLEKEVIIVITIKYH